MSLNSPHLGRFPIGKPPRPGRSANSYNSELLHSDVGQVQGHRSHTISGGLSRAAYGSSVSDARNSFTMSPNMTHRNVDSQYWANNANNNYELNSVPTAADEFETFGSISTKLSEERARRKMANSYQVSNSNNNHVDETANEVVIMKEIDECTALNSASTSVGSGVSADMLITIRSEMNKALQKLKELEIQVATIPGLHTQISLLNEENKRLREERYRLKAQIENMDQEDEFVEKQVVEEVTRHQRPNIIPTSNILVSPAPSRKPEMHSKAVGTVVIPKSVREIGVGEWIIEEENVKETITPNQKVSQLFSETSIGSQTQGNAMIDDFSVGRIPMYTVSTMTIPMATRTVGFNPPKNVLSKSIGIWCRLDYENNLPGIDEPIEDETITKKSVTVKTSATTKSASKHSSEYNQGATSSSSSSSAVKDQFDGHHADNSDESQWTETTIIKFLDSQNTSPEYQSYYSSLISKLMVTFKTNQTEFMKLLVQLLAKKVKSVATLVYPETRSIACVTSSTRVRTVAVGDDVVDVIVRPLTILFDKGVSIRPEMIHKYSTPDKSYYYNRGVNTDMLEVYDRGITTRQSKTNKASGTIAVSNREVGVMKDSNSSIYIPVEEDVPYTKETWETEAKILGDRIIDEKETFRSKEIRMTRLPVQPEIEEIVQPTKIQDAYLSNLDNEIVEEGIVPEVAHVIFKEDRPVYESSKSMVDDSEDYNVATKSTYVEKDDDLVRHVTEEHRLSKTTSEIPRISDDSDSLDISGVIYRDVPYGMSTVITREESIITSEEKRISKGSRSGSIDDSKEFSDNEIDNNDFVLSSPLKKGASYRNSSNRSGFTQNYTAGGNISINKSDQLGSSSGATGKSGMSSTQHVQGGSGSGISSGQHVQSSSGSGMSSGQYIQGGSGSGMSSGQHVQVSSGSGMSSGHSFRGGSGSGMTSTHQIRGGNSGSVMSSGQHVQGGSGSGMSSGQHVRGGSGSGMSSTQHVQRGSGSGMSSTQHVQGSSGSGMSSGQHIQGSSGSGMSSTQHVQVGSGSAMSSGQHVQGGSGSGMSSTKHVQGSSGSGMSSGQYVQGSGSEISSGYSFRGSSGSGMSSGSFRGSSRSGMTGTRHFQDNSGSGMSSAQGFSGRKVELSDSLNHSCVVLSQWLNDSTHQSAREIKIPGSQENEALNTLRQEWLSLFTSEEFDYLHIEGFISSITQYNQGITDKMINMYHPDSGNTAMHFAVQNGYWSVIGLLLKSGKVNLTKCNSLDETPLSMLNKRKLVNLSSQDRHDILELHNQTTKQFLEAIATAEENGEEDITIETPIISAVNRGGTEFLEMLFDLGVSVNERDTRGRTALMTATINNDISMVKMLIGREDTDVFLVDDEGNSANRFAIDSNNDQIAYLLHARENLNKPSEMIYKEVVELFKSKFGVSWKSSSGMTKSSLPKLNFSEKSNTKSIKYQHTNTSH